MCLLYALIVVAMPFFFVLPITDGRTARCPRWAASAHCSWHRL
jgi:hypothetical protein